MGGAEPHQITKGPPRGLPLIKANNKSQHFHTGILWTKTINHNTFIQEYYGQKLTINHNTFIQEYYGQKPNERTGFMWSEQFENIVKYAIHPSVLKIPLHKGNHFDLFVVGDLRRTEEY